MWRRLGFLGIFLGLFCSGAAEALAQPSWLQGERYLDVRLGLNAYGGERRHEDEGGSLLHVSETGGAGIGLEAGLYLSPRWSVGAFVLSSRYPNLMYVKHRDDPDFEPIETSESSDWVHKLGVLWRRRLAPEQRFVPYLQAGGSLSFSLLNNHVYVGGGPRLGAGVDMRLTRALHFFTELDGVFVLPGNAMDLAGPARDVDLFSFFGFGLRYRMPQGGTREMSPIRISNVYGAAELREGEEGVYAASVAAAQTGGRHATYRWDFGDGTTVDGMVATHRFAKAGIYTVTFVADTGTVSEKRTLTTVVREPVEPVEVMAIRAVPLVPRITEEVAFSVLLRGSEPIACRWDFGDGVTADRCEAAHRYVLPGEYTVTLEVSNPRGTTQSSRLMKVRENPCVDLTALNPVYFERNESTLDVDARGFLRDNISRLVECPAVRLAVQGYAEPGERDGRKLSEERARAVADYYMTLGIPADRIDVQVRGPVSSIPEGEAVWQYRYVASVPVHE